MSDKSKESAKPFDDQIAAQLMSNPEMLAAIQKSIESSQQQAGYYACLPKVVKQRVKALKKLQVEMYRIDAKFSLEEFKLRMKFEQEKNDFYLKRAQIISGEYQPTPDECDFPSDSENEEGEGDEVKDYVKEFYQKSLPSALNEKLTLGKEGELTENDIKGVPNFWLQLLKSIEIVGDVIQEHDEPILSYLKDVQCIFSVDPLKYTLEFHFAPNEYFTDSILTKEYFCKCDVDEEDPFAFDGLALYKCTGSKINWNPGKNVTEKVITKKQKHKSKGSTRTVTKVVKNDSFFNLFDTIDVPEEEEVDEETAELLEADFEIGEAFRHQIIPRAVLYFTGDALAYSDYDEEEDEDEEFDAEEESDDDNPQETSPRKPAHKKGHQGD